MLTGTLPRVTDGRVLPRAGRRAGHRPDHPRQPRAQERLRPGHAPAARRLPRRAGLRRRHQGRAAARRGWRVQHRRRHGQRLQLVRRRRLEGRRGADPSQRRRLLTDRKTFDFYQFFLGYPKVTVAEVSGLRARWRLRAGPDGRHRRRRPRRGDRDAGHPLPRAGPGLAPPLLPPPRPGAGPSPAAHRRHHQGRRDRPPRRSSPRSSTPAPSRPAPPGSPRRSRACRPTAS